MKILNLLAVALFLAVPPLLTGETYGISEVEEHDWEAGTADSYYFFEFNSRSRTVDVVVRDLRLRELRRSALKYDSPSRDESDGILIYQSDREKPSYIISYNGESQLTVTSPPSPGLLFRSFDTVKDHYGGAELQGIFNYDRVRLRTAPNLEGVKIGSLMKGDVVEILNRSDEKMAIEEMNSFWFKVKTKEGLAGWAYGYFMEMGNILYASPGDREVIFRKFLDLDQGSETRLLFYENREQVGDSGWLACGTILTYEKEKRVVAGGTNRSVNRDGENHGYVFDFRGLGIADFPIPAMAIEFGPVDRAPLFYIIDSYGLDSSQKWSNRCIVYDLDGAVVHELQYNDSVSRCAFRYGSMDLAIRLPKP